MFLRTSIATRRTLLFAGWLITLASALRFLAPLPARDEDEYWRWLLFGTVPFAMPVIINFIIILLIILSLEKRMTRARVWILSLWTLGLVGPAWVVVRNLWLFAFPLFALLLLLCLALGIEALGFDWFGVNSTKSARRENPL